RTGGGGGRHKGPSEAEMVRAEARRGPDVGIAALGAPAAIASHGFRRAAATPHGSAATERCPFAKRERPRRPDAERLRGRRSGLPPADRELPQGSARGGCPILDRRELLPPRPIQGCRRRLPQGLQEIQIWRQGAGDTAQARHVPCRPWPEGCRLLDFRRAQDRIPESAGDRPRRGKGGAEEGPLLNERTAYLNR